MFDKLDDLLIRFEEVLNELGEPDVTSNPDRFQKLMKEQSDLQPIVDTYKEYKKNKETIQDSLSMLEEEKDEDMREMLKEELSDAKKRVEELEQELNITIFSRTNRGVVLTAAGEEFLGYARQVLEQTDLIEERYTGSAPRRHRFSVSTQHYSFAVNAFVDLVKQYDASQYNFILRETQTGEIIDDVAQGKSEVGILYLSAHNEEVLTKLMKKNGLVFEELFVAEPHVFICREHPLANKKEITLDDLQPYPYLVYEQGERNSFYFAEEFLSMLDFPKNIQVRDRATLFNLVIGLNGFTVCSGVIDQKLNGENIIAKPLVSDCDMRIGMIRKKNTMLSRYALYYQEAIKNYLAIV